MKAISLLAILILCLSLQPLAGQDAIKKKMPLMVSHLPTDNKTILRRKGADRHNIFNKVICFKRKCRSYIGWRTRQRSQRFKGYRDGGKVPRPSKPKIILPPPTNKDTVMVQPVSPMVEATTTAVERRIFILDEVLFEINSARLNTHFTFRLDSLVDLLRKHPGLKATISGHTDNTGSETHNLKLSRDRAESVAVYITSREISTDRISFEGWGSSKPIAGNTSEAGRQKNRRVEIILSGDR